MLVLKLNENEVIRVGKNVYLSLGRRPRAAGFCIGIHAPEDLQIDRIRVGHGDLKERMQKALMVDEYEQGLADAMSQGDQEGVHR